jgi:hypothetical protein
VASLLTLGRRFAPAAQAAIVLDLGARGLVDVVRAAGTPILCTAVRARPPEPLAPYDEAVLDRLAERWPGAPAPVATLLPDPRDRSTLAWTDDLGRRVFAEARRLGLVEPLFGVGFRRTDAGRAALAHWLALREELLAAPPAVLARTGAWEPLRVPLPARAVAIGAAPDLLAALSPPDERHVWSGYGGRWRLVRIGRAASRQVRDGLAAAAFDGQVVRRWKTGLDDGATWFVAVDDGAGADARVWSVMPDVHARFPPGSLVHVTTDARGRLLEMTPA